MAYIGKKPEDKFRGLASYDTFTGDGSTTTFDTTNILPDGGTYDVEVFVDNVRQEGGAGKSYTIGNDDAGDLKRITFAVAPDNAAEIYVINPGRNTAVVTVTDNSLTAAKLQTDAVTTAKIQDDAVTNAKIGPAAVGATEISPGSITTTQISPSAAITNSQLANNAITINGTSIALGASGEIVAGTDWQAVTVADGSTTLNAEVGKGYFLDTNAGVIEVFLPTSPTRGDTVVLADYSGTFATNKVLVNTGGALIDSTEGGPGSSNEFELKTNNQVVELVYVDAAKGWLVQTNSTPSGLTPIPGGGQYDVNFIQATGGTVTESGDFKIHTFTGDGCFVVSNAGEGTPSVPSVVDYLVVAGGGGGQWSYGGGGGGGFRYYANTTDNPQTCNPAAPLNNYPGGTEITLTAQTYPITVGAGGAGSPSGPTGNCNTAGSNSIFATVTSAGGGKGGNYTNPGASQPGVPGGSGGGGGSWPGPGANPGGTGNTPPVSPPQGNNGGSGLHISCDVGGGGGGATAVGTNGTQPYRGGSGGAGAGLTGFGASNGECSSCKQYFSGGGGAGASPGCASYGNRGIGGGANGNNPALSPGPNCGLANAGGGGGGGHGPNPGAQGGKGIVVIRYKFQ